MASLVPLSRADHGALGWFPNAPQVVSKDLVKVPLALDELATLALHLPILVHVTGDLAEPVFPVADVARQMPVLFDDGGRWLPPVFPVSLRQGPFRVVPTPKGEMVMVDPASFAALDEGQPDLLPLFADGPALHPDTLRHLSRLKAWRHSHIAGRRAAVGLLRAGCLKPWRNDIDRLHVVDPEAVSELAANIGGALHEAGALRLAHLSHASLGVLGVGRTITKAPEPAGTDPFLQALREGFT